MRSLWISIKGWLQGLVAAFQFLTRLPIPVHLEYTDAVFRRSVVFYPIVGAAVGGILLLGGNGVRSILPDLPSSVLLLVLWVVITGGLHLDGLMDTADGILSHRPREQMLEIMKDSRVGAMGVIVCVLHLLLKFSLLAVWLGESWAHARYLLVLIPLWSRWFMVAAIVLWPYARKDSGLGIFFRGVSKVHLLWSTLVAVTVSFAILAVFKDSLRGIWMMGHPLLHLLGFAVVTMVAGSLTAAYLHRKLGGLTGDTYGALNELLEVLLLLVVAALL